MDEAQLQALAELVGKVPEIQLAILFGSTARGRERPDSDIDLAVAGDRTLNVAVRAKLIESIALVYGRPIDLVDLREAGYSLLREALLHGRLIHCVDPVLLVELKKKMLFDREDFLPLQRRALEKRRRKWIGT